MDLASLIKRKERTVWAEFRPGFEVELRYVSLPELRHSVESAERAVVKGGRVQQAGLEGLAEKTTCAMIKDWKLPAAIAPMLLEVEPEDLKGKSLPCTEANKLALIREVNGFSRWVNQMATELANFRAAEVAAETKN